MNDLQRARIKHGANVEAVRRMLIKYFIERGFTESFDRSVNPVLIQDMPVMTVGLENKIEIEPHAIEIDPRSSRAVLGWNMYVLGNQRIYLGETHHNNLLELARQIKQGMVLPEAIAMTQRCTTPRRIITFIERVLGNHGAGYVDLSPRARAPANQPRSLRNFSGAQDSQFYQRAGYGG